MNKKLVQNVIAASAIVIGALFVVAQPALADNIGTVPSGCGISPTTPYGQNVTVKGVTQKRIFFGGSAHCGAASSIGFRLVHNYTGLPDVRVTETVLQSNNTSYTGDVCDNGGTTSYYSEIALYGTGNTVQKVSGTATFSHC